MCALLYSFVYINVLIDLCVCIIVLICTCVYVIVLTCVFVRCCAQMYVHHCTHQHRPSDPVTLGELMMPPHGGKESKLKLPEKRKVSKRPFSYLAAMDSPNGNHAHNIHILSYARYTLP